MNQEIVKFIQKQNINIEEIYDDLQIYEEREINRIISDNKLEGKTSTVLVSIADIIGYDYKWRNQTNNLVENFSNFFGTESAYQMRSIGMLDYNNEEIIEKLYESFKREPPRILELDNGRKVVSGNGLHRYILLRIHYINELNKVRDNKEAEENLKMKYEIPVELTKVDLLKTYCQFIIRKTCTLDDVYVSNINGEEEFVNVSENGKEIKLNRMQLLKYTKNRIRSLNGQMKNWLIDIVSNCCQMYDSFKKFIEENFSEELAQLIEEDNKKGRGIK